MRRLLYIILTTIIISSCGIPTKHYFKDGGLYGLGYFKNGVEHGYWKYYHENGTISASGNFKDSLHVGFWKFYNQNGQLVEKGYYKDGYEQGIWETYYNGDPQWEKTYENGNLLKTVYVGPDGPFQSYGENGKLKWKGNWKNGKQHGLWELYAYDGWIYRKGYYKNDNKDGVWKEYYLTQLIREENYIDGKLISEKCWNTHGDEIKCKYNGY